MKLTSIKTLFGIDLRTLAIFRVCLGLLIIADLILRARDLTAHYTDTGIMPRSVLLGPLNSWQPSLHLFSGSSTAMAVLFLLAGLIASALVLGYRTRLATILSWLLLISLQARNPMLIQGGDDLLRMLLFWSMFLPLGARFSIDAALDRNIQRRPNAYFSLATAGLEIQCMSVYFFSAILKSAPEWIPDGTAIYYVLHLDYLALPGALVLREFPLLMQGMTWFVWYLQIIGPVLIFSPLFSLPLRLLIQSLLMAMHASFIFTLAIGLFPYISLTSLLTFTPGWLWDRIDEYIRTPQRSGVKIFYDGDCEFCLKVCLILRTFLLLPETPIRPAQQQTDIHDLLLTHNSWVVEDFDGSRHVRWHAIVRVFRRSVLFAPLGWLFACKPLLWLGERIYASIARNRPALGRITTVLLPYRSINVDPSRVSNTVVAGLIVLVFYFNLNTINAAPLAPPQWMSDVRAILRLQQIWNMFAPAPSKVDGWYVIPAEGSDSRIVDAFKGVVETPDHIKPEFVAESYSSYRWRKYLIRMTLAKNYKHRRYYAQYLCNRWNKQAGDEHQIERLSIYFNREYDQLDYLPSSYERILLWKHECFGDNPDPFADKKHQL